MKTNQEVALPVRILLQTGSGWKTLTTKAGMLILTNGPEQTQQGEGFQLESNTLQNSRANHYNILNF